MPTAFAGIDRFPRVGLGHMPTPLDPAPNLGRSLGIELWIKRDDCTGLASGGNKVRQLEFYLGEAQARGADTVLITGAVQSNFVRLAAAGARKLGMEIHVQLEERVERSDDLYRRSGSGLTHAGTLVGLRALGERVPVHGICVRRDAVQQRVRVAKRTAELAAMIGRPEVLDADDVDLCDEVHPPGYGRLNDAVGEAILMAARLEALLLDPVYTGKAMAGLVALVRSGRIAAGSRVLFVHTGGLPAIFSYAAQLEPWFPPDIVHRRGSWAASVDPVVSRKRRFRISC